MKFLKKKLVAMFVLVTQELGGFAAEAGTDSSEIVACDSYKDKTGSGSESRMPMVVNGNETKLTSKLTPYLTRFYFGGIIGLVGFAAYKFKFLKKNNSASAVVSENAQWQEVFCDRNGKPYKSLENMLEANAQPKKKRKLFQAITIGPPCSGKSYLVDYLCAEMEKQKNAISEDCGTYVGTEGVDLKIVPESVCGAFKISTYDCSGLKLFEELIG
jgi:Tfp pilus assembly protein PilE